MSNQSTIAEIRKNGLNKETLARIDADYAEMEKAKQDAKERLPGQFLSLKQDKEMKTFLFTGNYQKVQKPATDFITKQEIPGKTITKFRFQVYDVTNPDSPTEVAIWERGLTEAGTVLHWFKKGITELTIMRNGGPNSKTTSYNIFPVNSRNPSF